MPKIKLIPGHCYTLKYSTQFSHACGARGFVDFSKSLSSKDTVQGIYIGCVPIGAHSTYRNIFAIIGDTDRYYMSFAIDKLNYIV